MRYLSVCSGIEACSVAWQPLGWQAAGYSEIEPFPRAVLEHRFGAQPVDWDHRYSPQSNAIPLFGDFTKIEAHHVGPVDLLVGGTPCQAFSVAGKRLGLDDPRGHLTLEFLALARRIRPQWLLWENVPGVLSDDDGRTLGTFLGLVGELGYRGCYRVLDAQFVRVDGLERAVPQRRRRVFFVGHLGDDCRAFPVLFEPESLRGHPAPRRQAGQGTAADVAARTKGGGGLGTDFDCDGGLVCHDVAPTLNAAFGDKQGLEDQHVNGGCGHFVAHALRADGFDASEDGTGRGTPIVPVNMPPDVAGTLKACAGKSGLPNGAEEADRLVTIAFTSKDYGNDAMVGLSPTLRSMGHDGSHANGGAQVAIAIQECAVSENPDNGPQGAGFRADGTAYTLEARHHASCFDMRGREGGAQFEGPHDTANVRAASGGSSKSYVAEAWAVRRLTPRECERLQGFPDDWTLIPWRKGHAADGPRYKAIGNSMAVNVMRWIGVRIDGADKAAGCEA
jgi:DNA (cytosine-5)-methyltransferase 1